MQPPGQPGIFRPTKQHPYVRDKNQPSRPKVPPPAKPEPLDGPCLARTRAPAAGLGPPAPRARCGPAGGCTPVTGSQEATGRPRGQKTTRVCEPKTLGEASPCIPGILLFRKKSNPVKRMMVQKNGESSRRKIGFGPA